MKKHSLYALAAIGIFSVMGVGAVSASGWFGMGARYNPDEFAAVQESMFQNQASLLGMSEDDYKEAWAEGKSFFDIAQEKGITQEQLAEKMKEARKAQMKENLQILVDKGVISQAQADRRFSEMEQVSGRDGRHTMPGRFGGMHALMGGMF